MLMVGSAPVVDAEQNIRIASLSSASASVCQELDVPYLNIFTRLQTSDVWIKDAIANAGAHPLAGGYAQLADIVKNYQCWLSWFQRIRDS